MKNKIIKTLIITIAIATIFIAGSVVGATQQDWMSKISQDAAQSIDSAGKNKKDELTTNIQDNIHAKVKEKIAPLITSKESEIQDELDAYFNEKITTITDGAEYQSAVQDLERIKSVLLDNYKSEIDRAFAGQ